MKITLFIVLLIGSIVPISAMDELSIGDPAYQEISTPKASAQPRTSRQRRTRHGTGSRRKNQQTMYDEKPDKFGSQEEMSASESPYGTTEGESN